MSSKKNKGVYYTDMPDNYSYDNNYSNNYVDNYDYNYDYTYTGNNKKKKSKIISVVICIITANIAIFVLYCVRDMSTIQAGADAISNYASNALATTKPVEIPEEAVPAEDIVEPTPTPTPEIIDSLKDYYNRNNDLIGWLKIDGTPIDNPVMFTPENEVYYLDKDFDGNEFKAGTLFIDDSSRVGEGDTNIIIYGHNMKNQTMFGSLKKYAQNSYYQEHKYITFNHLYEECTYEVMAAFYAKVLKQNDTSFKYYQFTGATNETDYNYFVDNILSMALYETNIKKENCQFGQGDQFITLSTCSYHTENGRFVVVAKKINQ